MGKAITFNLGQGGLGRPIPGKDFISALLFYSGATLPTGFTASDRIKIVYSLAEAVALGITNTSLGETKSTATYAVSNKGAVGDTHKVTVTSASGETLTLCNYTQVTADVVSTTTAAARMVAEINLLTYLHGFTATNSTNTVTVTAAPGQGIYLNSGTPYVSTIVGTLAGAWTQNVIAGVASDIDIMYYHISEYFRAQPKGKLYVGIYATADATTFASVTLMQDFAEGEIRQIGIYQKTTTFAAAHLTTLQAILTTNSNNNKPLIAIYQGEMATFTDLTTLPNLHSLTANNTSATFGQDGAGAGFKLWNATGKSIGCVGLTLGAVAFGKVSDNIGWIGKFDMNNGVEMNVLAFANGNKLKSLSDVQIDAVGNLGYIYLEKEIDAPGSYFNDSYTATALTSDYAYIEDNRVIQKSKRNIRLFLLPSLSSPIAFNEDGTISEDSVAYFESLAQDAVDQMVRDGEISASKATIDPTQKVLSTNQIIIVVEEIPTGVARNIVVNLGYTTAITN